MHFVENPPFDRSEGSGDAPVVVFGPVPDDLTELQSRFVDAFIQLGGNAYAAAEAAGYGKSDGMGLRNLAKPKIQNEIVRRLKVQGGTVLAIAIGALLRVIENPASDEKAVTQAALGLMDRFGMAPPRGPAVAVQVNQTNVNGHQAQSILAEVLAAREARLSGKAEPVLIEGNGA
mgnify:CR=1 FL=1